MSMPQQTSSIFELRFPQSVGIYQTYADAQKAVDYLADERFDVQNLAIVGTDLKSVSQTVATKYEVLCEHKVAAQAREMLQNMPGARASAFE